MSFARRSITLIDPPDLFAPVSPTRSPTEPVAFDDEREGLELARRRAVFVARRAREARATTAPLRSATDRRGDADEARRVRAWWAAVAPSARTR